MAEHIPSPYEPSSGTLAVAHVVYALHTMSILMGLITSATIVGAFLFTWPSIIAVILNYVMRSDARNTYVESHFAWQIRTFWYAALWFVLLMFISLLLGIIGIGVVIWLIGFLVMGIWVAYRIIYGWITLKNHHSLPL